MNKSLIFVNRILAALLLIAIILAVYLFWARPYQLHWGATAEEIQRSMPGDELNFKPEFLATRAITIDGTPEEIWPWLLQMGYGRAGFYAYDIFENFGSPRGIRSADRILPEFQHFKAGDEVPISPAGGLVFHVIEPDQYLIWSGGEEWGGFTWALYPMDETHTRLVSRIRFSYSRTNPTQLTFEIFTEFADHLAVRKILQGIKGRVEDRFEPPAQANIEFVIYLLSFIVFLWSVLLILLGPLTWQQWLAGLAAGAAWLITWYAPVPIWVGLLVEVLAIWNIRRARHMERRSENDNAYLPARS